MAVDNYTKDFFKDVRSLLHSILGRLDQLVGVVDRPRDKHKQPIRNETTPTDEAYATVGKILVSLYEQPPEKHPERKNKWYRSSKWWRGFGQGAKDFVEVVAFIFAIGYAIVTYLQWKDLRHNFEVDERSMLKVGFSFPAADMTGDFFVNSTTTNVGKSPAEYVTSATTIEIVPSGGDPAFLIPTRYKTQEGAMFFPAEEIPNHVDFFDKVTRQKRPLTQSEIDDLIAGKTWIAVYGMVAYHDQFGDHWHSYCTPKRYGTEYRNADLCIMFNRMGDGPPPNPNDWANRPRVPIYPWEK